MSKAGLLILFAGGDTLVRTSFLLLVCIGMYGWNKSNEIEFKKELTEIVSCRLNLGLFMKRLEKMIMNCTVLDWFMKYVLHEDTDFCRPETKLNLN